MVLVLPGVKRAINLPKIDKFLPTIEVFQPHPQIPSMGSKKHLSANIVILNIGNSIVMLLAAIILLIRM